MLKYNTHINEIQFALHRNRSTVSIVSASPIEMK